MKRWTRSAIAIFLIAVIAVAAIFLTQKLTASLRLDITDQKLYTLSEGTKAILAGLNQPITLKLFYTKTAAMKAPDQIRFYNNYYAFVRALLDEYVRYAKGNIRLEVIDPRPYSEEEVAAIRYGLKRFSINEEENFFFGLVVQTQFGATRVIDFFSPERQEFIEYDISYLIDTALTRQKKRIGIISSLPLMGDSPYMVQMMRMQGQQPREKWGIISHLEQKYDVSEISKDAEKIENIDILLVIHPKELSQKTQFAIDQFVLSGGRAIVMLDPHCVMDRPDPMQRMQMSMPTTSSNLPTLLKAWGIEMPENTFAGDRELAVVGSTAPNRRPERILGILQLQGAKGCFEPTHAISAKLNQVTVMFPGALKKSPVEGLSYTPLIRTTNRGNTWTVSGPYELMMPDYAEFMRRFRDGAEPVVMGYVVSGTFRSAFPDGIEIEAVQNDQKDAEQANAETQQSEKIEKKKITGITTSSQPGVVVILSDVDMIADGVAYQRTFFGLAAVGDNSALIMNALDDLSGSANLISIRSRGNFKRPFTRVDAIEAQADAETAEEEANIQAQIKGFQEQLNERIRALEGDNKGELINKAILEEKKAIEVKLLDAERRLREVKMKKRQQIETLKVQLRNFCTLPGPILTLLIAVGLAAHRSVRKRYYISHASDA